MDPVAAAVIASWSLDPQPLFLLLAVAALYLRGWLRLRIELPRKYTTGKLIAFAGGLLAVLLALASPVDTFGTLLLLAHMIQHLLLMTFAPALILLGEPLLALWQGLPRFGQDMVGLLFQLSFVQRFARTVTRPALCWAVSALTLMAWHVPALFMLGMQSAVWHSVEQGSFLVAGLFFWWPVVQAWPSNATGPQWSILLYLFLATLPCDILSGFLVFSDRVAYPVYFSMPRHSGLSVLEDQQCAAALMWTCVTLFYLVPAAIISVRLLVPRTSHEHDLQQSQFSRRPIPQSAPRSLEVV